MNPRPGSSLRSRLTSPPPSRALVELQKQGLELAVSPPSNGLRVASVNASRGSTPGSDLDKPLPLEPFEEKRRSSSVYSVDRGSVYSTDTTIANILRLYSSCRDLDDDDFPPLPVLHQPQAYRDTVAPLLITRLSLNGSNSPLPMPTNTPAEAASNSSLRSAAAENLAVPNSKAAPSFLEFHRQLQQRRDQLVSPFSEASSDQHRRAAHDQLTPLSPQVSSVELSVSVSQTPPLPDAKSVLISEVNDSSFLPSPPGMSSSSLPHSDWEKPAEFDPAQHEAPPQDSQNKAWPQDCLNDRVTYQSPAASPEDEWPSSPLPSEDRDRILSYAGEKSLGMKRNSSEKEKVRNSSARQGVGSLIRSISGRSVGKGKEWSQSNPPRERQLAIPATPYQLLGPAVFDGKLQKKQQREAEKQARQAQERQRTRRQRGKSLSLANAYSNGQTGLVKAVRKLTRKSSGKRQKQLKDSIIVVGPSETRGMNGRPLLSGEAGELWI